MPQVGFAGFLGLVANLQLAFHLMEKDLMSLR